MLQREREKEVGGLLQLAATILGFVVMLIVQVGLQSFVFSKHFCTLIEYISVLHVLVKHFSLLCIDIQLDLPNFPAVHPP